VADSMLAQFIKFLKETNALALAIAVVIGGAIGKLVTALVADIIMPIVGVLLPSGEWRTWKITLRGDSALAIGDVLGATVDFVIVAFVVFMIAKTLLKTPPAK
jgi:large conductance mechanosensitive channel